MKNIRETKNYFIEEINRNEFISKKHKKITAILNYSEHLLILASMVTVCIWISTFASLVGIPIGITRSSVGLKICATTSGIKNYKSIIKKKEKKTW